MTIVLSIELELLITVVNVCLKLVLTLVNSVLSEKVIPRCISNMTNVKLVRCALKLAPMVLSYYRIDLVIKLALLVL